MAGWEPRVRFGTVRPASDRRILKMRRHFKIKYKIHCQDLQFHNLIKVIIFHFQIRFLFQALISMNKIFSVLYYCFTLNYLQFAKNWQKFGHLLVEEIFKSCHRKMKLFLAPAVISAVSAWEQPLWSDVQVKFKIWRKGLKFKSSDEIFFCRSRFWYMLLFIEHFEGFS